MRGEPVIVKQLLNKAKDSALMAVEFYNKPAVTFKSEGFIVMMCIAWTSLFHAYFFKNKIKPYYRKTGTGKRSRFIKIKEKISNTKEIEDYKWWELQECIKEYFNDKNNPVRKNLEFFAGIRNLIVHRSIPELDANLYAECQANILNFNSFLIKNFGEKHRIDYLLSFSLQLFNQPKNFMEASKKELKKKNATEIVEFIKSFRSSLTDDIFNSPEYAFKAVLIQVKNHESKDALALRFVHEKDLTEEQKEQLKNIGIVMIKEKTIITNDIPSDYLTYIELKQKVITELKLLNLKKFEKFKEYFKIRHKDTLVAERIHNPKSKKSPSTFYYNPKIIDEFKKVNQFLISANQSIVQQIEGWIDKIRTAKKQDKNADTTQWEREIDNLVFPL